MIGSLFPERWDLFGPPPPPTRYTVAADLPPPHRRLYLVRFSVRSRWGTARAGLTFEEAERECAERNRGAAFVTPGIDPDTLCTCGLTRWRCAAGNWSAHLRRGA
jgi:hypothetical protein